MILKTGTCITSNQSTFCIESVLGHGTFGITYSVKVVKGLNFGKRYALKEFFINGVSSREDSGYVSSCSDTIPIERCKEEFVSEAKNLINLNHPNIVKAYEVFEANGTVYYTMDYIEGENLNTYLKNNTLTVNEVVKIITKIAYGLSYMHESQHMLHLDLKPGNVMRRSSDGQIILIDFGLSRYFTDENTLDGKTPVGLGTKGYAPVEQSDFKNRVGNFKATIDVYALGATFYKLITGNSPQPANVLMEQPHLLRQNLEHVGLPEDKIAIIEKAMSPFPENRYQSVMSFIYDINADERKRRKKGLVLSVIIMICAIVIGFISFNLIFLKSLDIVNPSPEGQEEKQKYYNELDNYAFEITEPCNGANHYGQTEYYKFFSDGTIFYMFDSWHDFIDCDDSNCSLESRTDTATLRYKVVDKNKILFKTGYYDSDVYVIIDLKGKQINIGEDADLMYISNDNINWNEIKKMLER